MKVASVFMISTPPAMESDRFAWIVQSMNTGDPPVTAMPPPLPYWALFPVKMQPMKMGEQSLTSTPPPMISA
ncbi:MAG: hypothetical protein CMJ41_02820 [Phycisphaerae bacterium]|nr:hypothetical protein [Phycisphaerae bacterium]